MPRRSLAFASRTSRQNVADWPASARVTGDSLCLMDSTETGAQRPYASGPKRYSLSPVAIGDGTGEERGDGGEEWAPW